MKISLPGRMGTIDLKYLVEDTDRHGNVRVYFRRAGAKLRLRQPPGSEPFMIEYREALAAAPVAKEKHSASSTAPGSLRVLCERYYGSAEFLRLGKRTRYIRRLILDSICRKHGHNVAARTEARHVRKLRDEKMGKPGAANERLKALRGLFAWAVADGTLSRNPAREVPYLPINSPGWHTWTEDEVRRFEARHPIGGRPRLALALLLYTGVRRSDVVGLGRQMERDGWLHFTEAKGRERKIKQRAVPILPQLRAVIDATPSGHMTYIVTSYGKPFSANGFGTWFSRQCDAAGLPHCSAHGLRKAGATIAANNGASEHQLMAIFGWESPKQAAVYTRQADRKRLVGDAMHLIVPGK